MAWSRSRRCRWGSRELAQVGVVAVEVAVAAAVAKAVELSQAESMEVLAEAVEDRPWADR